MPKRSPILDRYFLEVSIERALFNAYILIFLASALVTFIGILKIVEIDDKILNVLVYSLIVEVIGGVTALFSSRVLKKSSYLKIRLNIVGQFDRKDMSKITASYTLLDPDTGEATDYPCTVFRDDFSLCINISPPSMKRTISIAAEIDGVTFQGSDWLETRAVELRKV